MPWAKVPVRTTAGRVSLWGFRGETPGEHRCYSFLSGPNITLAKAARITGSKIELKVSQTHRLAPLAGAGPGSRWKVLQSPLQSPWSWASFLLLYKAKKGKN